jgi:hypothetical protein
LTSSRGFFRPSCARPLGGPRISSATWHRLVLAACCLGCLLRGTTCSLTTWPRLCTPAACTGAGAPARGTSYWSGSPTQRVKRSTLAHILHIAILQITNTCHISNTPHIPYSIDYILHTECNNAIYYIEDVGPQGPRSAFIADRAQSAPIFPDSTSSAVCPASELPPFGLWKSLSTVPKVNLFRAGGFPYALPPRLAPRACSARQHF